MIPVKDFLKFYKPRFYFFSFFDSDVIMEIVKRATADLAIPANFITSARAVTNLFKNSACQEWLQSHRSEVSCSKILIKFLKHSQFCINNFLQIILVLLMQILDAYSSCCSSSNKNIQLSYSTLILK